MSFTRRTRCWAMQFRRKTNVDTRGAMKSLGSMQFKSTVRWCMLLAVFLVPRLALGQWQVRAGSQFPDCLAGGDADQKLATGCQARQVMAWSWPLSLTRFGYMRTTVSPGSSQQTKLTL